MKKLIITAELEYDEVGMHGDDPESVDWFYNEILFGRKEDLILHSNDIGDEIGRVKILIVNGLTRGYE